MNVTGCALSLTVSIDFDVLAELLGLTKEEVFALWDNGELAEVIEEYDDTLEVLSISNGLYEYGELRVGSGR